jgi:hypothetical protein
MKLDITGLFYRTFDTTPGGAEHERESAIRMMYDKLEKYGGERFANRELKVWLGDATSETNTAAVLPSYVAEINELKQTVDRLVRQKSKSEPDPEIAILEAKNDELVKEVAALKEQLAAQPVAEESKIALMRSKLIASTRGLNIALMLIFEAAGWTDENKAAITANQWSDEGPMTTDEFAYHGERLWGTKWSEWYAGMAGFFGIRDIHSYYENSKLNINEPNIPDKFKMLRAISADRLASYGSGPDLERRKKPPKTKK